MKTVESKIIKLLQEAEEKWTQKVHEKFHPPAGTFSEGSAEKIADVISEHGKAPYKTAIARLNFFLNRGGKNVSPTVRAKVEKAKKILEKRYANKKD